MQVWLDTYRRSVSNRHLFLSGEKEKKIDQKEKYASVVERKNEIIGRSEEKYLQISYLVDNRK